VKLQVDLEIVLLLPRKNSVIGPLLEKLLIAEYPTCIPRLHNIYNNNALQL